ncbi:hypothetical protein ABZP36_002118 [Zizania latifolia]
MDPELRKAAMQGSTARLQELVGSNPKILDSKTPHGNTALHIAATLGHVAFAREALALNSDMLVAKNYDHDTPLHMAARYGKAGRWPSRTLSSTSSVPPSQVGRRRSVRLVLAFILTQLISLRSQ